MANYHENDMNVDLILIIKTLYIKIIETRVIIIINCKISFLYLKQLIN